MEELKIEFSKMNVDYQSLQIIQNKDGIVVARVKKNTHSLIIKYFERLEFRREIENYKVLSSLNIPTLNIISTTDNALLMGDICESNKYRLGIKEDLDNSTIAPLVAEWYRLLHHRGVDYIEKNDKARNLYDENDVITLENIQHIKQKTLTSSLPVWNLIEKNYDIIHKYINNIKRTLTYNDFYYTNLIVAKEQTSVMMYDYNLLGKGYAYADIRNVCASLSPKAKDAFMNAYGEYDPSELIVDEVASVITTLYLASRKEKFPTWANKVLEELYDGYEYKVNRLLELAR